MKYHLYAIPLVAAAALAACGGGYGGGGGYVAPGGGNGGGGVGALTIGFALPDGAIGTVSTPPFGTVGGYTQKVYSQVLAFPPGTVVTLKNLSSGTPHTLNVLSMSAFPATPASLSTTASGSSTLDANFKSGTINPGGTMSVTLANAGTYYIGCAYHYNDSVSMRDVLEVSSSATPGPQATAQPGSGGIGSGGGGGY
ncbi:MAG TPA: hypothetical protein VFL13_06830 [Candidatus Baltobacteraceae bacterium]|nr:hypothetical protein [Candidatus Baltobacteraceae bacterium]